MVLYPNKLPESERVCSGICMNSGRRNRNHSVLVCQRQLADLLSRTVYQNLSFRRSLRVAHNASLIVLEHPENIFTIKIKRHALLVGKDHFHRRRIQHTGTADSYLSLLCSPYRGRGSQQAPKYAQRQDRIIL